MTNQQNPIKPWLDHYLHCQDCLCYGRCEIAKKIASDLSNGRSEEEIVKFLRENAHLFRGKKPPSLFVRIKNFFNAS
jgi:hypothetical protein